MLSWIGLEKRMKDKGGTVVDVYLQPDDNVNQNLAFPRYIGPCGVTIRHLFLAAFERG